MKASHRRAHCMSQGCLQTKVIFRLNFHAQDSLNVEFSQVTRTLKIILFYHYPYGISLSVRYHNFTDCEKLSHSLQKLFSCYRHFSSNKKVIHEVDGHIVEISGEKWRKKTLTFHFFLFPCFILFYNIFH